MAVKKQVMEKQSIALFDIDLQSYEPTLSTECVVNGHDYVRWGDRNNYPQYLYDTYTNCGVLKSIIDGCADFTFGKGVINNTGIEGENQFGDTIEEVIDKIIIDRWIFGGFAMQVKYNKIGDIISLAHIDFRKCRINEACDTVFVNNRWDKWGSNRYDKFHAFDRETGAEDGVQIYYYKGYRCRGIYPVPDYAASLVSAETLIKIGHFHYDELNNNFMASGIMNFNNGVPGKTEMEIVERKVNDKFCGVRNKGNRNTARLMVSFNTDKDHATTFDRLATDDLDTRYQTLYSSAMADVFISLRCQPILFGLPSLTGFADQNFDEAFDLLNDTHISKKQSEIKRIFAKIFDNENAIIFIPFKERDIDSIDGIDSTITDEQQVENDKLRSIPTEVLSDLTVNERRELIGYPELQGEDANQSTLADRLGVGGTQALTAIIENTEISTESKRGLLEVLFGLSQEDISKILV